MSKITSFRDKVMNLMDLPRIYRIVGYRFDEMRTATAFWLLKSSMHENEIIRFKKLGLPQFDIIDKGETNIRVVDEEDNNTVSLFDRSRSVFGFKDYTTFINRNRGNAIKG